MEMDDAFRAYNAPLVIEGVPGFGAERWAGLQAWSANAGVQQVPELIAGIYGEAQGPAALWASIRAKDETLSSAVGSPATRNMNAAGLDYLFSYNASLDVPAALAVLTAGFGSRSAPGLPVDILARAAAELDAVADVSRGRGDLKAAIEKIEPLTLVAKSIEEVGEELTAEKAAAAMNEILQSTLLSMQSLATNTRNALRIAETRLAQADEECDVLWYVFGAERDDAVLEAVPFKAAFLAAAGLAERTPRPLHSRTFRALSARLNVSAAEATIKSAIEEVPLDWILANVDRELDPRLYPLHRLLDRYREFGSKGAAWSKGMQDVIGFAPSLKVSALDLGQQFYREKLLKIALS